MTRVLSGGSIYVSNCPGQHDFQVRHSPRAHRWTVPGQRMGMTLTLAMITTQLLKQSGG